MEFDRVSDTNDCMEATLLCLIDTRDGAIGDIPAVFSKCNRWSFFAILSIFLRNVNNVKTCVSGCAYL